MFLIKKVKNTVPWSFVISDLNIEELLKYFTKKIAKKTSQKELKVGEVIKKNSDKLHVTQKGCNSCFNSWIDKKDINV